MLSERLLSCFLDNGLRSSHLNGNWGSLLDDSFFSIEFIKLFDGLHKKFGYITQTSEDFGLSFEKFRVIMGPLSWFDRFGLFVLDMLNMDDFRSRLFDFLDFLFCLCTDSFNNILGNISSLLYS